MILIPPTHGRAAVRNSISPEYLAAIGEDGLRQEMARDLNRLYQEEFGVDVPESWLSWHSLTNPGLGGHDFQVRAEAPTRSNTVWIAPLGEARTVPIAVTTESRIPIVQSPYRYADDNPYRRPEHVLTFKGWDAETGLMVFDR